MYIGQPILPHCGARHLLGGVEFERLDDNFVLITCVAVERLLEVIHDEFESVWDALLCLLDLI